MARKRRPGSWQMVFDYFDAPTGVSATSRPANYSTRADAVSAARFARQKHVGGGIRVTAAYARPTTGWFRGLRTFTIRFQ